MCRENGVETLLILLNITVKSKVIKTKKKCLLMLLGLSVGGEQMYI